MKKPYQTDINIFKNLILFLIYKNSMKLDGVRFSDLSVDKIILNIDYNTHKIPFILKPNEQGVFDIDSYIVDDNNIKGLFTVIEIDDYIEIEFIIETTEEEIYVKFMEYITQVGIKIEYTLVGKDGIYYILLDSVLIDDLYNEFILHVSNNIGDNFIEINE